MGPILNDAVKLHRPPEFALFFFNDTATTEIYTLSLHDALPISPPGRRSSASRMPALFQCSSIAMIFTVMSSRPSVDRKSTRLNSSHGYISNAVFCLKKKKIADEGAFVTAGQQVVLRVTACGAWS